MIAHFIGGPIDGQRLAVREPPISRVKVPELNDAAPYWGPEVEPYSSVGYTEHEYRLIYTKPGRHAVYEWIPPKITANFAFTVKTGLDRDLFYRKVRELLELYGEVVKTMSIFYDGSAVSVEGIVLVDGPADAQAAQEATEAVKSVIDRKLRFYQITAFAVDVHD